MGLLIPSSSSSGCEKDMVSLSRSEVLRAAMQVSFPTSLTQNSNLLSHMAVLEVSQCPPSQSSCVGLSYDISSKSIVSVAEQQSWRERSITHKDRCVIVDGELLLTAPVTSR